MQNEYAQPGTDLYYAVRSLDPKIKAAYLGVSEVCHTFNVIAETYKDASIAEQKLLWWKTEIERFFDGEASHPLLKALELVKPHLSKIEFLALLEANLFSVKTHIFDTRTELLKHYQHLGGIRFALLARMIKQKYAEVSPGLCHELGVVSEILRHLIGFRHFLGRQHLYFALEDFQRQSIDPAPILRLQHLASLKPLFNDYVELAKQQFNQLHLERMNPLRLEVLLQLKQAKLLQRHSWQVFSHQLELSPVRKLLITTFL